jgi:hypothetical protein
MMVLMTGTSPQIVPAVQKRSGATRPGKRSITQRERVSLRVSSDVTFCFTLFHRFARGRRSSVSGDISARGSGITVVGRLHAHE